MKSFLQNISLFFRSLFTFGKAAAPIVVDAAKIAEPIIDITEPEVAPIYNAAVAVADKTQK